MATTAGVDGGAGVLTTVKPGTMMTVGGKQQMVPIQNVGGKQTIVITRPAGQGAGLKQQGEHSNSRFD